MTTEDLPDGHDLELAVRHSPEVEAMRAKVKAVFTAMPEDEREWPGSVLREVHRQYTGKLEPTMVTGLLTYALLCLCEEVCQEAEDEGMTP
jgi:hypothetical protein